MHKRRRLAAYQDRHANLTGGLLNFRREDLGSTVAASESIMKHSLFSWSLMPGVKRTRTTRNMDFFFFPSNCRERIQSPSKARRPLHHGLQQRWQWRQLKPGEKPYNAIMRIVQDTGYAAYVATCRRIAHLGLFFVFLFFLSSPSLRSDHCDSFDNFLSNSEISLPDIYIKLILYFDMIIFFTRLHSNPIW